MNRKKPKAIIVCGGLAPSLQLLKSELNAKILLLAADGGANCLFKYKIIPNWIIGDLDSISKKALAFFEGQKVKIERYQRDKAYTDGELALQKAIQLGAKEIVFLGGLGRRLDHTLGNLGLLARALEVKIAASLKDEKTTVTLLDRSALISGRPKTTFSLQTYSDTVTKLSISGSKFTLKNYTLKMGEGLTLSNQFLEEPVKISFQSGRLLVIQERSNHT
jgi:thiamine pyrophosphokinase